MTVKLVLQTLIECLVQTRQDAIFYASLMAIIVAGTVVGACYLVRVIREEIK